MVKKRPVGIIVFSSLVIASSVIMVLSYYFLQMPIAASTFAMTFSIYPVELLFIMTFLPLFIGNWFFAVVGAACGIGVLFLNNVFRIICIVLAGLKIIAVVGIRIVMIKLLMKEPWSVQQVVFVILSLAVPVLYIIYLTRPKVKALFR